MVVARLTVKLEVMSSLASTTPLLSTKSRWIELAFVVFIEVVIGGLVGVGFGGGGASGA